MRTLKLQMQVSLDGFVAGTNGEMDWMTWNWDEALKSYVGALTEPIDTILPDRPVSFDVLQVKAAIPAKVDSLAAAKLNVVLPRDFARHASLDHGLEIPQSPCPARRLRARNRCARPYSVAAEIARAGAIAIGRREDASCMSHEACLAQTSLV